MSSLSKCGQALCEIGYSSINYALHRGFYSTVAGTAFASEANYFRSEMQDTCDSVNQFMGNRSFNSTIPAKTQTSDLQATTILLGASFGFAEGLILGISKVFADYKNQQARHESSELGSSKACYSKVIDFFNQCKNRATSMCRKEVNQKVRPD